MTQKTFGKRIRLFHKTPSDIVCPHFYELVWARGCPYNCAWCYLQGTYRIQGKQPYFYPRREVEKSAVLFCEKMQDPQVVNTGELADSLMGEHLNPPFSEWIVKLFGRYGQHRVLFLSKMTHIQNILHLNPFLMWIPIFSWSLNANPVACRWEHGAPSVKDRLEAAQTLDDQGYEVRIRIDPMVPIKGWMEHYQRLVDQILDQLWPERITLGSLRGLQSTINNAQDKSWVQYLSEKSGWGLKIDFDTRALMYSTIIDYLHDEPGYDMVALCKETHGMWQSLKDLGMDPGEPPSWEGCRCNCVW
ncbi:MAG: spore photoproduct lyase family protein [Candidatus Bathyarchaeia archaeon]